MKKTILLALPLLFAFGFHGDGCHGDDDHHDEVIEAVEAQGAATRATTQAEGAATRETVEGVRAEVAQEGDQTQAILERIALLLSTEATEGSVELEAQGSNTVAGTIAIDRADFPGSGCVRWVPVGNGLTVDLGGETFPAAGAWLPAGADWSRVVWDNDPDGFCLVPDMAVDFCGDGFVRLWRLPEPLIPAFFASGRLEYGDGLCP